MSTFDICSHKGSNKRPLYPTPGSPFVNLLPNKGDVIGIIYMRYVDSSLAPVEGIGFAIPINTAKEIIPVLKQGGSQPIPQITYQPVLTTNPCATIVVPTTIYYPPVTITVPATTVTQLSTRTITATATTTPPPTTIYQPPTTVYYTRTQVVPSITTTTTPFSGIPDNTIFSYSGIGPMTLPSFAINSACRLVYTADWTGNFTVFMGSSAVISNAVTAGQTYETYLNGYKGSYYFWVSSAQANGHWTLTVYPA